MLMNEFDSHVGGGGAPVDVLDPTGGGGQSDLDVSDPGQSTEPDDQGGQPTSPMFTAEQVTQMMQAVPQQPAPAPQQQMTQEEMLQRIGQPNVPELTALGSVLGLEEDGMKLLTEVFNAYSGNVNQHTLKLLGALQSGFNQQLQTSLAPLNQMQQEQETKRFISTVTNGHPGLKGQEKVIETVVQQMANSGYQYTTDAQAIQDVVLQATQLIRSVNPQFNPSQAAAPQNNNGGLPQMNGSFMNSTSGSAGAGGNNANQPQWKKAFNR